MGSKKEYTHAVRFLYHWALDLLLPPRCVVCGKLLSWLCDPCAQQLALLKGPLCPTCGRVSKQPLPQQGGPPDQGSLSQGRCKYCRSSSLHLTGIRAAFLFTGPLRDAIHAFKYRGATGLSRPLALRMAEAWHAHELHTDVLVPVPLHPRREAQRGYNQARLLAQKLGLALDVPVASRVLLRTRHTASQTHLGAQARRENVQDAFACLPGLTFSGRNVTLVDDVVTTGSTLDACAVALLEANAASVNAFTLARAA